MNRYRVNYILFIMFSSSSWLYANEARPVCVKVESAPYRIAARLPASKGKGITKKHLSRHSKRITEIKTVKKTVRTSARVSGKKRKPSSISEDKMILNKYTPLYWSGERDGAWILVNDVKGARLWVQRKHVSTRLKCVTVKVGKSNLREGPGAQFPVSEVAARGNGYLDLGSEDGWIRVKNSQGRESWMNLDHIWRPVSLFQMKFEDEKISQDSGGM